MTRYTAGAWITCVSAMSGSVLSVTRLAPSSVHNCPPAPPKMLSNRTTPCAYTALPGTEGSQDRPRSPAAEHPHGTVRRRLRQSQAAVTAAREQMSPSSPLEQRTGQAAE